MDNPNLVELLESDKEMILADLKRDKAPAAAQTALEKALDRVMYRYMEACTDGEMAASAQHILQSLKTALPLVDSVGDVRQWKKSLPDASGKRRLRPAALAFLGVGLVLILATVLALALNSRRTFDPLAWLQALGPAVLGGVSLFWGGVLTGRPEKAKKAEDSSANIRYEYLTDTEKVWHDLRSALLMADSRLEAIREENAARLLTEAPAAGTGALPAKELELLSGLLETAYALRESAQREDAAEMISAIAYYLHTNGIDTVDYDREQAAWFELLPSPHPGTIRPALIAGGRLLKKGLASA